MRPVLPDSACSLLCASLTGAGFWVPGPTATWGSGDRLQRLSSLCPGLDQVGEGQLSVNPDELRVVGGFGVVHLLCRKLLPRDNQRLGVCELPNEPPVPMADRLSAAEVS